MRLCRCRFYCFIGLCLLPLSSLFSQALTLQDILKIHSLDSAAARQYCDSRHLPLVNAGNTGSAARYQYATPDSSIRMEINYPNDSSSLNIQINYWFSDAGQYKRMKGSLRKEGFRLLSAKETDNLLPANAKRYLAKNMQVELIQQGKQSYWLFLHPAGKYTW